MGLKKIKIAEHSIFSAAKLSNSRHRLSSPRGQSRTKEKTGNGIKKRERKKKKKTWLIWFDWNSQNPEILSQKIPVTATPSLLVILSCPDHVVRVQPLIFPSRKGNGYTIAWERTAGIRGNWEAFFCLLRGFVFVFVFIKLDRHVQLTLSSWQERLGLGIPERRQGFWTMGECFDLYLPYL